MYRITIERIETAMQSDLVWQKTSDTGNRRDNGPVYEYVCVELAKEERMKIFEQVVQNLNITSVIQAINALA